MPEVPLSPVPRITPCYATGNKSFLFIDYGVFIFVEIGEFIGNVSVAASTAFLILSGSHPFVDIVERCKAMSVTATIILLTLSDTDVRPRPQDPFNFYALQRWCISMTFYDLMQWLIHC